MRTMRVTHSRDRAEVANVGAWPAGQFGTDRSRDAPAHSSVIEDPGLAVLTRAGSRFGIEFLRRLAASGRKPGVLCIEHTPFRRRFAMARFLARKIGVFDAARYNVAFWLPLALRRASLGRLHPLPRYEGSAGRVIEVDDINSATVCETLADRRITRIVLAQSGIVRGRILALGKRVLNAHPGSLPRYRGVDVVRWALLERGPLEVTLHQVDAGIDTGPVIGRRAVPVDAADSWRTIEARALDISLDMLVAAALDDQIAFATTVEQPAKAGRQYFLMPFSRVRDLEQRWPELLAKRLAVNARRDVP